LLLPIETPQDVCKSPPNFDPPMRKGQRFYIRELLRENYCWRGLRPVQYFPLRLFAALQEGICCCTTLRQTAFRNHPGCAQPLICDAKVAGQQFDSAVVTDAQIYAAYGCPEVLHVLLQLGTPDEIDLFENIIIRGNIQCIRVAIHAKFAVKTTAAAAALLKAGPLELCALARGLGYPQRIKKDFPKRYAAIKELLAHFKLRGSPQVHYETLAQMPRNLFLSRILQASETRSKVSPTPGQPMIDG
jgi:hypothetical protein